MDGQAISHLLQEHARARRLTLDLEALLEGLAQDPQWTPAHARVFEEIRCGLARDLCRLVRKEKELLYPLLEPHFERDSGPLANLRAEHALLSERCGSLCGAAERLTDHGHPDLSALGDFQSSGRAVVEILGNHLYKEERVLFPMAARLLTAQQHDELLRRMQALETAPLSETSF